MGWRGGGCVCEGWSGGGVEGRRVWDGCVRGMEWRWGGGEEGVDGCV